MNKNINFIFFFACIFNAFSQESLSSTEYEKIIKPIEHVEKNMAQEVLYVQTDKDIYETGEEIWFNATIFQTINNQPFSNSQIVYFNLLNQERKKIHSAKYAINDSSSNGNFYVSDTITPGKYYLSAYTKNSIANILNSNNSIKEIEIRKTITPKILISEEVENSDEKIIKIKIKLFLRNGETVNNASVKLQATNNKKSKTIAKNITDSNGFTELYIERNKIDEFKNFNLIIKTNERLIENKSINLSTLSNKINVEFYPEGGNLIEGINQKIAIKFKNRIYKNSNSKAYIIKNNKIIDSIDIDKNGIGIYNFKPMKLEKYFVKIDNNSFEFPKPKIESTKLVLVSQNKSNYNFEIINKSENLHNKQIYIRVQAKGIIFWLAKIKLNKERINFRIPKHILPNHITEISLIGIDEDIICTRYIYSNFEQRLYCKLLDYEEERRINNKSKVKLKIQILDKDKNPVNARANITVFDNLFKIDTYEHSMQSFLKIENDITPKLNYPTEYFRKNDIDNLMLTLDKKSYKWNHDNIKDNLKKVNILEDLKGSVYLKNKSGQLENPGNTEIYITTSSGIFMTETNKNGFFSIDAKLLELFQNEKIILNTSNENLFINLLKNKEEDIEQFYSSDLFNRFSDISLKDTIVIKNKIKNFSFNSVNFLDEVVLTKKLPEKPKYSANFFEYIGGNNDHVCFQFNVLNCKNHRIGFKPRHGEYYYVVEENSFFPPTLKKYIDPLALEEEAKLEEKKLKSYVFIETLKSNKNFPHPNYELDKESLEFPDYRKTLFWSNNLNSNSNGIIEVEFFTSDITGLFIGEIDVFDENGNFGSLIFNLSVNKN